MKLKSVAAGTAIAFAVILANCGSARAQGQWCAHYEPYIYNCGFNTFQQCLATISGVGGVCSPNYRLQAERRQAVEEARPRRKIKKRRR